jgi:hypothetical protein
MYFLRKIELMSQISPTQCGFNEFSLSGAYTSNLTLIITVRIGLRLLN